LELQIEEENDPLNIPSRCTEVSVLYPDCFFVLCFRGMSNKEMSAKMKKGVISRNTVRGMIMDSQAVVEACKKWPCCW
jgi:hypothetical protein